MPNFQASSLTEITFPIIVDGFNFKYSCYSQNSSNEKLIMVSYEGQKFFLQHLKRERDYLVKAEKLSKPNSVTTLHKALRLYSSLTNAEVTFSNIEPKREKKIRVSPFLKKIDYFINTPLSGEVCVEVGFGSGRHLLYQAKTNPNTLFIGIEIHKPSIEQVLNLLKIQNITNVLIIDYDARDLLEILSSNSLKRIFVHFPVPWDKKPHRRVVSQEFLDECRRVLEKNGTLELRTDSINYYEYSKELMENVENMDLEIVKNQDLAISSKYEDRWKKMEKNIYDLSLTNSKISKNRDKIENLEFKQSFNLSKVWQNFKNITYRESDFFIHFEDIYKSLNHLVIKLSFGKNAQSEHKYIILSEDGSALYFPNPTLPTIINKKIHTKIKELLNE